MKQYFVFISYTAPDREKNPKAKACVHLFRSQVYSPGKIGAQPVKNPKKPVNLG